MDAILIPLVGGPALANSERQYCAQPTMEMLTQTIPAEASSLEIRRGELERILLF